MSGAALRPRSWLWLQGLACGTALAVAPGPVALLGVLLAPGLVAYLVEARPGKPVSEAMLLLGAATVFTPLRLLWEGGLTIVASIDLLEEPARVVLSWTAAAAAAAWLAGQLARIMARELSEARAKRHMASLRRERAGLVAEWGALEPQKPAVRHG